MKKFDYSTLARSFAFKHPILNQVTIQMFFWMYAMIFLILIVHIITTSMVDAYDIDVENPLGPAIFSGAILGMIYGLILGFFDILFERDTMKKLPLGVTLILRVIIYFLVMVAMVMFMRQVWFEEVILPHLQDGENALIRKIDGKYNLYLLMVYTVVMSAVISFIKLMNKKFGPGIIIPMIFGRYRNPKEQQRLFMFMDLKSSTTHAEKLGHIKYSSLIRDCFFDINQVLSEYNAEVYQYVGDEIVLSWIIQDGLKESKSFEFFFAVQHRFNERQDHYIKEYGFIPEFKAGLHLGLVTAVEVGEVKRDIAYHGDTLNTAARIQSICNQYNKNFLISVDVHSQSQLPENYQIESLGEIQLKGKDQLVEVFSVGKT